MSNSTFFVSEAAVRNLKRGAERHAFGVSSSHMSEGVAAALGFKTYAALRAALAGRATIEVPKPSNARLVQRLRQLGYAAMADDLRLLPEFEHSYSPFRAFPLRKVSAVRWKAWRNLLVAAINAGLEQRLFGLSPGENWWPGGAPESHACERSIYRFMVDGSLLAIASVDAVSGDELSLHAILNPRNAEVEPGPFNGLRDGDAWAHCWVERSLGAWIQDGGEDFSCKRIVQSRLAELRIEPLGYSDQGSFFI
ncbi:hypothetical protein [Thauera sinica]|uniref:Uncharacterized protein n=1 Tax=Thauera sinica TaxID=2665146 RepID=A0ABW1AWN2_9RHOO|nr:hypothetical protein [Thauera sp. K11]